MRSEQNPNNIFISVYEENKERIQNADNSSQEYIILQNEKLNKHNCDFIVQITEKDTHIEELEIDNDKMETSIKNMRDVMHNFSAKIKKQIQIIKLQNNKYKDLQNYTKVVNDFIKVIRDYPNMYIMITLSLLIASYIIGFITLWQSFVYLVFNFIKFSIIGLHLKSNYDVVRNVDKNTESMNQKTIAVNNNIRRLETEILEIDKSNNFIEEYIDNI